MATTQQALYGTNGQAITCTIDALANSGQRASTAVDNTTNLYLDALISLTIVSAAASTSATGWINVYAYATVDGGTTYTEAATGTDAAITLTAPTNAILIGRVNVVANSVTYKAGPMSVAAGFGGILPAKWGIIIENKTAATLGTGCSAKYQGVSGQSV